MTSSLELTGSRSLISVPFLPLPTLPGTFLVLTSSSFLLVESEKLNVDTVRSAATSGISTGTGTVLTTSHLIDTFITLLASEPTSPPVSASVSLSVCVSLIVFVDPTTGRNITVTFFRSPGSSRSTGAARNVAVGIAASFPVDPVIPLLPLFPVAGITSFSLSTDSLPAPSFSLSRSIRL